MRTIAKTILLLLTAAAWAGLADVGDALAQAAASQGPNWKPVTLVYVGDVGGKIEPCG